MLPELKHDICKDQLTINCEILILTKYTSISHMIYDNVKIVFLIPGTANIYCLQLVIIFRKKNLEGNHQPIVVRIENNRRSLQSTNGVAKVIFQLCVSVRISICPHEVPVQGYDHSAL